jgi:membrane-associated phospholipid phosphatase
VRDTAKRSRHYSHFVAGVHRQHGRHILTRTVAPGLALFVVIVAFGLLVTPPGIAIPTSEESISQRLEGLRTDTWNHLTLAWSLLGSTGLIIGVGIIVAALILGRTKNWRLAAVPVLASILQETIFLIAANIVDRPRPPVAHLDEAPPTASYPSGHVGASTALYLTFALLALHIRTVWIRRLTIMVCLAVPLLVAFGRLYRGMHHLTDIGAGLLNGITCAFLAHWWYRTNQQDRDLMRPTSALVPAPQQEHQPRRRSGR